VCGTEKRKTKMVGSKLQTLSVALAVVFFFLSIPFGISSIVLLARLRGPYIDPTPIAATLLNVTQCKYEPNPTPWYTPHYSVAGIFSYTVEKKTIVGGSGDKLVLQCDESSHCCSGVVNKPNAVSVGLEEDDKQNVVKAKVGKPYGSRPGSEKKDLYTTIAVSMSTVAFCCCFCMWTFFLRIQEQRSGYNEI